eukprot:EG_transcript_19045
MFSSSIVLISFILLLLWIENGASEPRVSNLQLRLSRASSTSKTTFSPEKQYLIPRQGIPPRPSSAGAAEANGDWGNFVPRRSTIVSQLKYSLVIGGCSFALMLLGLFILRSFKVVDDSTTMAMGAISGSSLPLSRWSSFGTPAASLPAGRPLARQRKFGCPYCPRSFIAPYHLYVHLRTVHGKTARTVTLV